MDVQTLIDEASDALLESDFDRAERIGKKLLEARHTYGFEVLARAHLGRDNLPKAIAVLEDGVKKAPRVWPLRILLGEFRSDHGDYDAALAAYDSALAIDGVDADEVHINSAVVLDRAGRQEEALARLERVSATTDDAVIATSKIRAQILNTLERPDAAIAAAQAGLARVHDDIEVDGADIGALHAAIAKALHMKGDRDGALERAWETIGYQSSNQTALALIRELEREYSTTAKYFRLTVRGEWHVTIDEDPAPPGFMRKYDVVADDKAEAMRYIARLEPEDVRPSLRLDELQVREDAPHLPKGVYWCSGHIFYAESDE